MTGKRVCPRTLTAQTSMTTTANLHEHRFSFHGLDLRYRTSMPSLLSSATAWGVYSQRDMPDAGSQLTIHFEEVPDRRAVPVSLSSSARRLFSGTRPVLGNSMRALWHCEILEDGGRLLVDVRGQGVLMIDAQRGNAQGYFFRPSAMHRDSLDMYFRYALSELLRPKNIFALDSTALELHGRGVLIAGHSGCGKTTALLSLLRSGYRYLSDDTSLLWDRGAGMEVLAFPATIEVADRTVAFFPELRDASPSPLRQGIYKKSFHAEEIYPVTGARSCEPTMILFPQVTNMPHSCLEPLSKGHALEALMPQPSFFQNEELAKREFLALSRLVQRSASYRLHFGLDVLDLPSLITPLVERH